MYARTGMSAVERAHTLTLEYKSVWIKIKKSSSQNLEFLTVYRPPNQQNSADESLLRLMKELTNHQKVLSAGDFSTPTIDCESLTVDGSPTSLSRKLMELTLDLTL
ncbi:unnamed protein product [Schistocephalus solidus]|uniref:Uncharacterized protein n=1 Tax=Schistocephalus solidus TaxID=70667 RepID=A0A183SDT6_SCHSO|nr:unnamed protein product [Schistocephalus solidus]